MSMRKAAPFMLSLIVSADALANDSSADKTPQLASYYANHSTFRDYTPVPVGDFGTASDSGWAP